MPDFNGTVYLTTNNINGKIYVGQTIADKKGYIGSGIAIVKAIKKYGKHNFTKNILISNIDCIKSLNYWEEFYIKLFCSMNYKIGYNIRPGGNTSRFKHTSTTINKIKKRSNQEDNKLRIRQIQKLASKSLIGTHKSKEEKLQMLNTKFGFSGVIEIYTKNGELKHICNFSKEASKLTGVKASGIRNNLSGLSKSAGEYIFKYKEI